MHTYINMHVYRARLLYTSIYPSASSHPIPSFRHLEGVGGELPVVERVEELLHEPAQHR